ncbi:MAG: hypothetical protein ABI178_04180 [Rhodanobacter sp.]
MFRSAVADWNVMPTGSMQPTIRIGGSILVDKLASVFNSPVDINLAELALEAFVPADGETAYRLRGMAAD